VIALDPGNAAAFNNRGDALMQQGRLDGAIEDFATALRLKPDYAIALMNRGLVLRNRGDAAGAIADFRKALGLMTDAATRAYLQQALKELGAGR
jgi:tetratricopeptide (TPR) repeat protein